MFKAYIRCTVVQDLGLRALGLVWGYIMEGLAYDIGSYASSRMRFFGGCITKTAMVRSRMRMVSLRAYFHGGRIHGTSGICVFLIQSNKFS